MVVASYLSKSQTFISVVAAAPDDEVLLVDETEGVLLEDGTASVTP